MSSPVGFLRRRPLGHDGVVSGALHLLTTVLVAGRHHHGFDLDPHLPRSFTRPLHHLGRVVDIPPLAVLESLAGAACYAVSTVLQQTAAAAQDEDLSMRPGLLLRLVRSGRWMVGNVMDVGGFVMQLLALRQAALALVEPLFVVGLVLSIIGAAFAARRRPTRVEVWASLLVVAGLVVFISAARPGPGHPDASAGGWIAMFVLTAVVVGGSVAAAGRWRRWRALLLGLGTGILYGVTSSLTERTGHLLDYGVVHTLESWAPYVLAVVSILGLLLNQSAYQAGDLRASLPVLTVSEPIVAIVIGQALFSERIGSAPLAVVAEVVGMAALTVGVFVLGRHEIQVVDPVAG